MKNRRKSSFSDFLFFLPFLPFPFSSSFVTSITALEVEMKVLQGILTPRQAAKFILWVSYNPADF